MTIKLYNTLSKKKEEFVPLKQGHVHMYVCGPTVYDKSHLGHARAYVAFDIIRRYLEYKGYKVLYINNITDVEDKIIKRAKELKKDPIKLAKEFEQEFLDDMDSLGVKRADMYPRASEHVKDMLEVVKGLIKKGYAYETESGVYYRVKKFEGYEKLSGLKMKQIKTGARVEIDEKKENPEDFALWKKAKPGEPSWDSPWGKGRPGWHIECSVMSMKYLGQTLDIHGGGQDLIFPHHTNEIAQSEAYTGKKFVNYWLHNGFVTINKEKMSKSIGNFFTVKQILDKYSPQAVRFFLLSTHYRSPIDFSDEHLKQAGASLERLLNTIENIKHALKVKKTEKGLEDEKIEAQIDNYKQGFVAAMDDDFNTTIAIAKLFDLTKLINKYLENKPNSKVLRKTLDTFEELGKILNLFWKPELKVDQEMIDSLLQLVKELETEKQVKFKTFEDLMDLIIELRKEARNIKDYEKSDRIRAKLKELGIILEDSDKGVRWKFVKN